MKGFNNIDDFVSCKEDSLVVDGYDKKLKVCLKAKCITMNHLIQYDREVLSLVLQLIIIT